MEDHLRELARPRPLVTRELYPFNAFYGHAALLRKYVGIRGSHPLKAAIEHGPTLFPFLTDPDLRTHLPRYFCSAPAHALFYEQHALHGTRAVAIGAPILYARTLVPPRTPSARRLVYFDAHSSDYVTAHYDVDSASVRLSELRDDFDEVLVCLYWRDVLLGRAELYTRNGFCCVTAGHMFDEQFLFRLIEIISSASIVLTDRLGSHLLYALALGRPVWLEHAQVEYELVSNAPDRGIGPPHEGDVFERASALFGRRVEHIEPDQQAFCDEFCGTASFRTPKELAELIDEAEAAYRSETPRVWRARLEAKAAARRLWNNARW